MVGGLILVLLKCNVFAQPEGAAQNYSIEILNQVTRLLILLCGSSSHIGLWVCDICKQ